jgi:hypothetical protein
VDVNLGGGKCFCNNSNNKQQTAKLNKKTINTSYTKSYPKKISTKSAQNEQNYFVKERKMLKQSKLYQQ